MSDAPHIYTLTGNLLAERTLEFESWSPGKLQRAQRESFQVGGKGINVSKMLNRLGAPNTVLCFAGGASGAECEAWLRERNFHFVAFPNDRSTRTGTVVRAPGQPETTFFSPDVAPSPDAIAACAAFLDAQPPQQVLALCGSFPGWSDDSFDVLRRSLVRWLQRGTLAVDVYGPPLRWAANQPCALVKINATEFAGLVGAGVSVSDGLAAHDESLARVGGWVVSDGPRTVWVREGTAPPMSFTPPVVKEVSATGSGDVMFAAILDSRFRRGATLHQAVSNALPLAAANAAHPGVAEFP